MKKTERPQTAKNSHPLQKYRDINDKHLKMKKTVQKTDFADFEYISGGSFNKTSGKDDVAIRTAKNSKQDNNDSNFLPLFASALLKTCGETTITYGIKEKMTYDTNTKNKVQVFDSGFYVVGLGSMQGRDTEEPIQTIQNIQIMYMDKADCDAFHVLYTTQQNSTLIKVLDCFRTDLIGKPVMKNDEDLDNYRNNQISGNPFCNFSYINNLNFTSLDDEALKTIARHFCKIFLFQMHDRKPENLLVLRKKQNKQIKHVFVECDFDDINLKDGALNILFGAHKGKIEKAPVKNFQEATTDWLWKERLNTLANTQYSSFINKIQDANKIDNWNKIFTKTIQEYTMTEDKIVKMIQETARNCKYMDISRDDLVTKISKKLDQFKQMCETPLEHDKQDILEQLPAIKEARKNTLITLNKFVKNKVIDTEKIGKIVDFELAKQDFGVGLETKKYYEDDGNIKKTPLEKQLWQELKEDVVNKSYNYPYRYVFFQDKNTKKEKFVNKKDEYNNIICKTKNGTIKTYDINGDLLYTQEIIEGRLQLKQPAISATETKKRQF